MRLVTNPETVYAAMYETIIEHDRGGRDESNNPLR